MFATPTAASQVQVLPPASGTPEAIARGASPRKPVSITQERTDPTPIMRLAREVESKAAAQQMAAPRPPRMAVTAAA
jgi:hypothetical protein